GSAACGPRDVPAGRRAPSGQDPAGSAPDGPCSSGRRGEAASGRHSESRTVTPVCRHPDEGVHGSASSTSVACPAGLIPSIARATLPSASITNVERLMPIYVFPAYFFSPHTPYFSATVWSGSASSGNGSSYFVLNFSCELTSSGLTPMTSAPR